MSKKLRVTILMRSMNSDWVIAQALAGLFSQTYKDFELLVVDSSSDRTMEIVEQYPHRLMKIDVRDYYPGEVLNMAIENTDTELIVFQNSDAVPLCETSLERLVAAFDDPQVAAAFGRQIPRPEADPWVRRDYAISFPESGEPPEWISFSVPLAGLRREIWKKRPFYTDAFSSEDTEWGHWAREAGLVVRYVPDAIVMHSHNYTFKQLKSRRYVEGEADAFIYGDRDSLPALARRTLSSALHDLPAYAQARDWPGLLMSPIRRAVYHWAYYKGHKLGERRKAKGDTDTSQGQAAVLKRYGK